MTNFYYEVEEPDEDRLDEEGNVLEKGLRKIGVCKEERKLPIVQMGLFMDDNGIPIAIETFPGNTLDHLALRPALKKEARKSESKKLQFSTNKWQTRIIAEKFILSRGQ